MSEVFDYDKNVDAVCPFVKGATCKTECMLMRPTGFGEPKCSLRVIADELVYISSDLRELRKMKEQ